MAKIHINIGSNQNRDTNIVGAIDYLKLNFADIKISDIFESPAEGFDGDDFYNIGVNASTNLEPNDVNSVLKNIEKIFGREKSQPKFSSRVIDLDLVYYNSVIDKNLNLPRDDILKYAFVLAPLAQLNKQMLHPIENKSYEDLWSEFQSKNKFKLEQYNNNKFLEILK